MDCKFKILVKTDAKRMANTLKQFPYDMRVYKGGYSNDPKNEIALQSTIGGTANLWVDIDSTNPDWAKILQGIEVWRC